MGDKSPLTTTEKTESFRKGGYFVLPERALGTLFGLVHIGDVKLNPRTLNPRKAQVAAAN